METSRSPSGAITVLLYEWCRPDSGPSYWSIVRAKHWKPEPGANFNSVHDLLDSAVWVLAFQ
jgi:hypothetical protein